MHIPGKATKWLIAPLASFWLPASFAATTLVSSDQQVASHPMVKAVERFGQTLSRKTGGELVVSIKSDGSAGSELTSLQAVREGKQAMARVNLALLDSLPAVKLASLPYLFRSPDHMWKVLDGEFGKRLDKEIDQAGYVRVMYLDSAPRNFYCKKPLRTVADFKGLKIRVLPSVVFEDLTKNLGAIPVAMSFNQVGDALRAGSIDCADGGTVNFVAADHHKIAPYLIEDQHLLMPEVLLMSKKVWTTLSPAQQKSVRESAVDASGYVRELWKSEEASALAAAKKAGVTVIPRSQLAMTAIEAQAIKTYNKYVKNSADLETVMKIVTTVSK